MSAIFMNNSGYLDDSRVKIAAAARKWPMKSSLRGVKRRGNPQRLLRSYRLRNGGLTRPKGKNCRF